MKILFVQDSLGSGGAEKSNVDLWYFLKEKGVIVKIVVLNHTNDGLEQEILNANFEVQFLKPGNYFFQVQQLLRIIRLFEPDIVQSVLFRSTMRVRGARILSNFFHLESLVSCPYDEIRFQDPQVNSLALRLYKWFDRLSAAKGTDLFVALTEEIKKHYIKEIKVSKEKFRIIMRGRKENRFLSQKEKVRTEVRKELGLTPEDIVFVHVGRQEYAKGHLNFLRAISLFDNQLSGVKAKFLFCGKPGNETSRIQDLLRGQKIQSEILFLGHRNDVYRILVASDVFVFPSLYEGIGGSLIEAEAAGLPIICSDLKPFYEVVEKGENAILFERRNITGLGKALLKLAGSRTLREEMGTKSLELYKRSFRIEKIHSEMLALYSEISNS